MNETTQTEMDHTTDEDRTSRSGVTSGAAFQAVVALWFAALFGGGCLFLPPVLFDMIFNGNAPFGPQTRIVVAIGAAGIGLLMGLLIASRVRSEKADADEDASPAPRKSRKSRKQGIRPPLDVRAALGLDRDDDDDDDDAMELSSSDTPDAFDLDDEFRAPIDDPHFASAWSDSDAYEPIEPDEGEAIQYEPAPPAADPVHSPAPEWQDAPPPTTSAAAPSRYNPFADFVKDDEEVAEEPATDHRAFETPRTHVDNAPVANTPAQTPAHQPAPRVHEPAPAAPPPPPAWPQPRSEEPALGELGVAELVERLARALQGQDTGPGAAHQSEYVEPKRSPFHNGESPRAQPAPPAQAPVAQSDIDRALRGALDRLSRLDDVA